jgi:hypothetical protein
LLVETDANGDGALVVTEPDSASALAVYCGPPTPEAAEEAPDEGELVCSWE